MQRKRKLPLKMASEFAAQNGVGPEVERIRADPDLSRLDRRLLIAALFEQRGILSSFESRLGSPGHGAKRRQDQRKSNEPVCFQPVSPTQASAIADSLESLTSVLRELRSLRAIRSQRVVGDLGEWIASQVLQIPICASAVQTGWDLAGDGLRVQVKAHAKAGANKARRTNLKADALNYDGLAIVALSGEFRLRAIYVIPLPHVVSIACNDKGRRIINWFGASEYAVAAVPNALGPLLSNDASLVADDEMHRVELVELRKRISEPAA